MGSIADGYIERVGRVYNQEISSARLIGAALGVSRNTVIGWYNRHPALRAAYPLAGAKINIRYKRPPAGSDAGVDTLAREARVKAKQQPKPKQPSESKPPSLAPLESFDDGSGEYTLEALPAGGCKWPSGENPTFFCGEPRGDDKAYCPTHRKRATTSYGGVTLKSRDKIRSW